MPTDREVAHHKSRLAWAAISMSEAWANRLDEIEAARAAGLNFNQIGEALGITGEAAGNLYRRHHNQRSSK